MGRAFPDPQTRGTPQEWSQEVGGSEEQNRNSGLRFSRSVLRSKKME